MYLCCDFWFDFGPTSQYSNTFDISIVLNVNVWLVSNVHPFTFFLIWNLILPNSRIFLLKLPVNWTLAQLTMTLFPFNVPFYHFPFNTVITSVDIRGKNFNRLFVQPFWVPEDKQNTSCKSFMTSWWFSDSFSLTTEVPKQEIELNQKKQYNIHCWYFKTTVCTMNYNEIYIDQQLCRQH